MPEIYRLCEFSNIKGVLFRLKGKLGKIYLVDDRLVIVEIGTSKNTSIELEEAVKNHMLFRNRKPCLFDCNATIEILHILTTLEINQLIVAQRNKEEKIREKISRKFRVLRSLTRSPIFTETSPIPGFINRKLEVK